jgi:hypothetical protein
MESISTVNVILIDNSSGEGLVQEVFSFPETDEGNKAAEKLFADNIRKCPVYFEQDIESHIEDGFFACEETGIQLNIVHSNT